VAVNVSVSAARAVLELPGSYLGVNLDWWTPESGEPWGHASVLNLDLDNVRLLKLTTALEAGTLRIGGTLDKIVQYEVDGAPCRKLGGPTLCLNMTRWAKVVDFAIRVGTHITWGLSYPVAAGTKEQWNGTNPIAFLAHVAANATQTAVFRGGIELGEEIDPKDTDGPQYTEYADSWAVFTAARNKLWPVDPPQSYGPCPGMPSFTKVDTFWRPILNQTAHQRSMDVVVYHSYNDPPSWPWLLDQTLEQAKVLVPLVAEVDEAAGLPEPRRVVLGEGGPHNGGGIDGVTNTFASSSYYLDALGVLPTVGVTGFNRQALIGGDYELINRTTFLPNPDYWVAYGYRLLVGPRVLAATAVSADDPALNASIRFYAHCARTSDPGRASPGDVVLFWSSADVVRPFSVRIGGLPGATSADAYVLTPHDSAGSPVDVFKRSVDLNGELLALGPDDSIPAWKPLNVSAGNLEIRPAAIGWVVLRGAAAPACE